MEKNGNLAVKSKSDEIEEFKFEALNKGKSPGRMDTLPIGQNKQSSASTFIKKVRNSLTVDLRDNNDHTKDRANTQAPLPKSSSVMVQKRDVISEAAELVKEKLFSRSSTTTENQIKIEDFEFKKHIRKTGPGKIYLAKLPATGTFYDVLSMRKDKLLQKGYVNSMKKQKDILFCADHPFLAGMEYLFNRETRLYFVMPHI